MNCADGESRMCPFNEPLLKLAFERMNDQLTEIKTVLSEARDQAKLTNGRVKDLELWQAEAKGWIKGNRMWWLVAVSIVAVIANVSAVLYAVHEIAR